MMIGRTTYLNYFLTLILLKQIFRNVIAANGDRGSFVGCYKQNLHFRRLDLFSGTSDVCISECEALYIRYAVLDGNVCFCTNIISETKLNDTECDKPCATTNEFCGGEYAQSYYDTAVMSPGPPKHLQMIKHTESSILIQWSGPEQVNLLERYSIQANLIKNYGSKLISPPLQWTIENTEDIVQYELLNLNPGSTYNITMRSYSKDNMGGGSRWITAETDIGSPEPKPPYPVILSFTERTLTIEIPPLVNNNGPITAIQVVVVLEDSEIYHEFDEHLIKGYRQAAEDGINYYITAELPNEITTRHFVVGNGLNYAGYDNVPLPLDKHARVKLGIISHFGNVTKRSYSIDNVSGKFEKTLMFNVNNAIDDDNCLNNALLFGCGLLIILLVLSMGGYLYLRLTMKQQLQRLPSDQHELTLQGSMMEAVRKFYNVNTH